MTSAEVRPPKDNAEWARSVQRELDGAENPTAVRVGPWVLSTSADDDLIASYNTGGSIVVARKPTGGENDPDAIQDNVTPSCTVTRSALQSIPSSGAKVVFDGVQNNIGPLDWTGGKAQMDAVLVPVSGIYDLAGTVNYETGGVEMHAVILVEGVPRAAARFASPDGNPWESVTVVRQLPLLAGQPVSLLAQATGVTRNIGAATVYAAPIPTTLSLTLVSRS